MAKKIGIVGGGIIGVSSAYYLQQKGHDVTIIDSGDFTQGCSFHNMGMIVPSHFVPLASPGMISKGIRWMFNSSSPFYIRPRADLSLLNWGFQFYKNSSEKRAKKGAYALNEISQLSRGLYSQLARDLPFDFEFHERGLMMLYKTAEAEHEEIEVAHLANDLGIEAHILSPDEVQKLEPNVRVLVRGGIHYPGDAHLTPQLFVSELIDYLRKKDVKFIPNTSITSLTIEQKKISEVLSNNDSWKFDEVIIATGSWSEDFVKKLNIELPLQPGKGYSFLVEKIGNSIQTPSIFVEARVAVTPMGNSIRFGGTMELSGFDPTIRMNRVHGIVKSIQDYYPDLNVNQPSVKDVWYGFRPCSPDGLPYIGRLSKISNAVIATGHAMLGMSLGPGTGKLVSEIIDDAPLSINRTPFSPERFG